MKRELMLSWLSKETRLTRFSPKKPNSSYLTSEILLWLLGIRLCHRKDLRSSNMTEMQTTRSYHITVITSIHHKKTLVLLQNQQLEKLVCFTYCTSYVSFHFFKSQTFWHHHFTGEVHLGEANFNSEVFACYKKVYGVVSKKGMYFSFLLLFISYPQ